MQKSKTYLRQIAEDAAKQHAQDTGELAEAVEHPDIKGSFLVKAENAAGAPHVVFNDGVTDKYVPFLPA